MRDIISYQQIVDSYKYVIILLALVSFILIPIHISVFPISSTLIVDINFTIIILSSLSICLKLKNSYIYFITGFATIILLWIEFSIPHVIHFKLARYISSILLFSFLNFILLRALIREEFFTIKSILGAMSGYLFLGLIGVVVFEIVYYLDPTSLSGIVPENNYSFYYFSFITITTLGFGDVVPTSAISQSVAILLTISGQFYLTVVVALFVGKFMSHNFKR